ncbi:hypothetical protein ACKKBF_B17245 [Auxenochlorella protothecoides x Auxenochlorella symbiontica]
MPDIAIPAAQSAAQHSPRAEADPLVRRAPEAPAKPDSGSEKEPVSRGPASRHTMPSTTSSTSLRSHSSGAELARVPLSYSALPQAPSPFDFPHHQQEAPAGWSPAQGNGSQRVQERGAGPLNGTSAGRLEGKGYGKGKERDSHFSQGTTFSDADYVASAKGGCCSVQ